MCGGYDVDPRQLLLPDEVVFGQQGVFEKEGAVAVVPFRRGCPLVDHFGRQRHLSVHVRRSREHFPHRASVVDVLVAAPAAAPHYPSPAGASAEVRR